MVDDSYNANPDSMRASLAMFAAMSVAGKRVAVLGDMGELGDFAPAGHRGVGAFAAHADIDTLICVGELAHFIEEAALGAGMPSERVMHAFGVDEALSLIGSIVEPGDAVLVKASHFMEFDQIVKGLVG